MCEGSPMHRNASPMLREAIVLPKCHLKKTLYDWSLKLFKLSLVNFIFVDMITPYLFEVLGLQDISPSLYVKYDGVGPDLGRVRRPEMLVSLRIKI